jgi:hypothetical protein
VNKTQIWKQIKFPNQIWGWSLCYLLCQNKCWIIASNPTTIPYCHFLDLNIWISGWLRLTVQSQEFGHAILPHFFLYLPTSDHEGKLCPFRWYDGKNQMVQGAEGSTSGIDLQCASKWPSIELHQTKGVFFHTEVSP